MAFNFSLLITFIFRFKFENVEHNLLCFVTFVQLKIFFESYSPDKLYKQVLVRQNFILSYTLWISYIEGCRITIALVIRATLAFALEWIHTSVG